ncbi:hypothetical protein TOPH_04492, partial [Tolypocladium ophioglossoides CBS 100239]
WPRPLSPAQPFLPSPLRDCVDATRQRHDVRELPDQAVRARTQHSSPAPSPNRDSRRRLQRHHHVGQVRAGHAQADGAERHVGRRPRGRQHPRHQRQASHRREGRHRPHWRHPECRHQGLPGGLHQATRVEPTAHKDAHGRLPRRRPGAHCLVAGQGPQQARPLLHLTRPQDGRVRCPRQRAAGALPHLAPAKGLPRPHQPQGQDHADCRQQPGDCADPKQRLPGRHGPHRRRANVPPGPRHRQGRLLEGHAYLVGHLAHLPRLRPEVPPRPAVGAVLQPRLLRHRYLHQHRDQEEAPRSAAPEALWRRPRQPHRWHGTTRGLPPSPHGAHGAEPPLLNGGVPPTATGAWGVGRRPGEVHTSTHARHEET